MSAKNFMLNPLCLSIMLLTGSTATAQATVTADSSARQNLNTLTNANGSDLVNINAPSTSGISHNKYSRFDVGAKGLVLNNSKESIVTSVTGVIAGNRNLATGDAARIILNEVTSNRASKLEGNLEVAGQKAHVIIANPNGITCNGCDFINTSRNTLTTGKPIMQGGQLTGFDVQKGKITVSGRGMKDNYSEYTDMIARYVQITAPVEANNLTVMGGLNSQVSIENNAVVAKGTSAKNSAGVGIDVSNLGGMYANKITLIANHDGVGVRNAGIISSQGDITIDSRGHISNEAGGIAATNRLDLIAGGDVTNNAQLIATVLNTEANNISTTGKINTAAASFKAKKKFTNDQGNVTANNYLYINAKDVKNNNGDLMSGGNLDIEATTVAHTQTAAISRNDVSTNKFIYAIGNTTIKASSVTNNAQIYGTNVVIEADSFDNKNSNIISPGTVSVNVKDTLSMANAIIQANQDVNITAGEVDNKEMNSFLWGFLQIANEKAGAISAGRDINYDVKNTVNNYNSMMAANAVTIKNGDVFNNYASISGANINLQAKGIYNVNKISATDSFQADGASFVSNDQTIEGANSILISTPEFKNAGNVSSAQTLVYALKHTNTGSIEGGYKIIGSLKPQEPEVPAEDAAVENPVTDLPDGGLTVTVN
jgi:filamentous hemagglutinin family protein